LTPRIWLCFRSVDISPRPMAPRSAVPLVDPAAVTAPAKTPVAAAGRHYVPPSIVPSHDVPSPGQDYVGLLGNNFKDKPLYKRLNWLHTPLLVGTPLLALYGLATVTINWRTWIWAVVYYFLTGLGITMGERRGALRPRVLSAMRMRTPPPHARRRPRRALRSMAHPAPGTVGGGHSRGGVGRARRREVCPWRPPPRMCRRPARRPRGGARPAPAAVVPLSRCADRRCRGVVVLAAGVASPLLGAGRVRSPPPAALSAGARCISGGMHARLRSAAAVC
jgi:hypothetical protein